MPGGYTICTETYSNRVFWRSKDSLVVVHITVNAGRVLLKACLVFDERGNDLEYVKVDLPIDDVLGVSAVLRHACVVDRMFGAHRTLKYGTYVHLYSCWRAMHVVVSSTRT